MKLFKLLSALLLVGLLAWIPFACEKEEGSGGSNSLLEKFEKISSVIDSEEDKVFSEAELENTYALVRTLNYEQTEQWIDWRYERTKNSKLTTEEWAKYLQVIRHAANREAHRTLDSAFFSLRSFENAESIMKVAQKEARPYFTCNIYRNAAPAKYPDLSTPIPGDRGSAYEAELRGGGTAPCGSRCGGRIFQQQGTIPTNSSTNPTVSIRFRYLGEYQLKQWNGVCDGDCDYVYEAESAIPWFYHSLGVRFTTWLKPPNGRELAMRNESASGGCSARKIRILIGSSLTIYGGTPANLGNGGLRLIASYSTNNPFGTRGSGCYRNDSSGGSPYNVMVYRNGLPYVRGIREGSQVFFNGVYGPGYRYIPECSCNIGQLWWGPDFAPFEL